MDSDDSYPPAERDLTSPKETAGKTDDDLTSPKETEKRSTKPKETEKKRMKPINPQSQEDVLGEGRQGDENDEEKPLTEEELAAIKAQQAHKLQHMIAKFDFDPAVTAFADRCLKIKKGERLLLKFHTDEWSLVCREKDVSQSGFVPRKYITEKPKDVEENLIHKESFQNWTPE